MSQLFRAHGERGAWNRGVMIHLGIALALAACGTTSEPEAPVEPDQPAAQPDDVAAESDGATDALSDEEIAQAAEDDRPLDMNEPAEKPSPKGGGEQTVIFMVLDTVRADHMSLCGYDRPTTPWVDALAKRPSVSFSCRAYSPATWTVPSHASYFTGKTVPVHESDSMGLTFGEDIPTLAEVMREQGYQSVMVSANPTLSERSGLQRGFEHILRASDLEDMRGEQVPKAVRRVLEREADPDKPLFLFVNVLDAHDPYPRVPPGVDWVPQQPEVAFDVFHKEQNAEYHRFVRGEMDPERARQYTRDIRNGYDYGIFEADRVASMVMAYLRREGWLDNGFRFVLTSDHGEFLGEHQLLRHGCYTWEPVVNVPFVYFDTKRRRPLELPDPFSALNAFSLVSTGKLPNEPLPVASFSKQRALDVKVCADMVSLWPDETDKLVWFFGDTYQYDLTEDPREMGRVPATGHPALPQLEAMGAAHAEHLAQNRRREEKDADAERMAELEALGYAH